MESMEAQGTSIPGLGVGVVLCNDRKEVLLMLRSQQARNEKGHWSIPGGAVEFGEKATAAIVREAKEECGIEIRNPQCIGYVDNNVMKEGHHWVGLIYAVDSWEGDAVNVEPDKCDEIQWFPIDALPQNMAFVAVEAIRLYQNVPRGTFGVAE